MPITFKTEGTIECAAALTPSGEAAVLVSYLIPNGLNGTPTTTTTTTRIVGASVAHLDILLLRHAALAAKDAGLKTVTILTEHDSNIYQRFATKPRPHSVGSGWLRRLKRELRGHKICLCSSHGVRHARALAAEAITTMTAERGKQPPYTVASFAITRPSRTQAAEVLP